jgi:hypothetical protein
MLPHRFNNDITTRSVITKGAMENAVKVCQAISVNRPGVAGDSIS